MSHYYAIAHSDGEEIQQVAELTDEQIADLKARGYWVDRVTVSPAPWPWLFGEEE